MDTGYQLTARETKTGADVPAGCPAWVDGRLIRQTIEVWQPYYDRPLTAGHALEIILNAGQLFDALGSSDGRPGR